VDWQLGTGWTPPSPKWRINDARETDDVTLNYRPAPPHLALRPLGSRPTSMMEQKKRVRGAAHVAHHRSRVSQTQRPVAGWRTKLPRAVRPASFAVCSATRHPARSPVITRPSVNRSVSILVLVLVSCTRTCVARVQRTGTVGLRLSRTRRARIVIDRAGGCWRPLGRWSCGGTG
jgi:hypothetical protein